MSSDSSWEWMIPIPTLEGECSRNNLNLKNICVSPSLNLRNIYVIPLNKIIS